MSFLHGIRVVELSDGLVDFGGRMLSELGAEVISLLSADQPARNSARTLAWHFGKTRFEVNGQDLEAINTLLDQADIVLDGRRINSGFLPDDLTANRPQLIQVVVYPYQPEGPYAKRQATDLTLMAMSGLMTLTGEPDRPPLRFPGEQAYALTGIQTATSALMALHARHRTQRGQRVLLSAFQSATLANYRSAIQYEWTGRIAKRSGNLLVRGKSGVRQVWPCVDGHVTWSMIDNPNMMRSLVKTLQAQGCAGELADIEWEAILVADTDQAVIDRWQGIFGDFFLRHTKAQLGEWSLQGGWGLSVINTLQEVKAHPHLRHRSLFVSVQDEAQQQRLDLPGSLFKTQPEQSNDSTPRRALSPLQKLSTTNWTQEVSHD